MNEILENGVFKTPLLVEQHFHGAYDVDFNTCNANDIVTLSKKLLQHGIGAFFPTLLTDTVENIKHQINVIKEAKTILEHNSEEGFADITGIHLEGIFLNPSKKGIHDDTLFLTPNISNYKLIEDDFIKIVTLAPELDKDFELSRYLKMKGINVQAGHCVGSDISHCAGTTHTFNAMSPISHKDSSTSLSALVNDDIYTEIIADGVHLNEDTLKLIFKSKPIDKIILISDSLPITHSDKKSTNFAGSEIFYDGQKATSACGTLAGSTMLLDEIIKNLAKLNLFDEQLILNPHKYNRLNIKGCVYWDKDFNIVAVEKDNIVIYKE